MKPALKHGIFLAVLAAALYALNSPFSKLLLAYMPSTLMAGFLYAGAGLGMIAINFIRKAAGRTGSEAGLTKKELPYTVAMVLLDIAAPIQILQPYQVALVLRPLDDRLNVRNAGEYRRNKADSTDPCVIDLLHSRPDDHSISSLHFLF